MTKEEMILYAEFMAGYDINQTPMDGLPVSCLIPDEANEVWKSCLIVKRYGRKVGIIPDKTDGELKVRTFTRDKKGKLFDYYWTPTDAELVAELKKQQICAPWVSDGAIKHIIVRKFPEVLKM